LSIVHSDEGKTLMDEVRRTTAHMRHAEETLLRERALRSQASARIALLVIVSSASIGVVLICAVFLLNQRNIRVRERAARVVAEEALREADRRKDAFLATLAHELRNPLAPIRNSIELLRRAEGDSELIRQASQMMERQVGQMVRLTFRASPQASSTFARTTWI